MHTFRRLYVYGISLTSLLISIWGLIAVAHSASNLDRYEAAASQMAWSFALTLIGLPAFWLHWRIAQRDAANQSGGYSKLLRTGFLYVVLLITLIPLMQNALGLINRLTFTLFHLEQNLMLISSPILTGIFGSWTWSSNLAAIVVNSLAAVYFISVLRKERQPDVPPNRLVELRGLFYSVWMLYGLGLTVFGVQQVIRSILYTPNGLGGNSGYPLGNGLALLLLGLPLWIWTLRNEEDQLKQPGEAGSLLRLAVLYILALVGVLIMASSAGQILAALLRWSLGETISRSSVVAALSSPLSIGLPMTGVWTFYGQRLNRELKLQPEDRQRYQVQRLYHYLLSSAGLAGLLAGLSLLAAFIAQAGTTSLVGEGSLRNQLAAVVAILVVAVPLWRLSWKPIQVEAGGRGLPGELNRRSWLRKAYLYLVLALGIAGATASTARLISTLVEALLEGRFTGYSMLAFYWLGNAVVFAAWIGYHSLVLRDDTRQVSQAMSIRHALFPVILLDPGDGAFGQEILVALNRYAPRLPAVVHNLNQGVPPEDLSKAKVIVLPACLILQPTEALRIWLQDFPGQRLVAPFPMPGWHWLGSNGATQAEVAERTALMLRQMAEK